MPAWVAYKTKTNKKYDGLVQVTSALNITNQARLQSIEFRVAHVSPQQLQEGLEGCQNKNRGKSRVSKICVLRADCVLLTTVNCGWLNGKLFLRSRILCYS
jgi:hypothetical protein